MIKRIYSAGTSTRSKEEFLELLMTYEIKAVVDVRRFPTSKFEHFKKENLQSFLKTHDIDYIYLGDDLGGYRKGGYEAYIATDDFSSGLNRLDDIASQNKSIFICAERLPWKCHRRFIGKALKERGWTVIHIIDKDKFWKPKD